jgi:hypothetical protein
MSVQRSDKIETFARAYEEAGHLRQELGVAWQSAREGVDTAAELARLAARSRALVALIATLEAGSASRSG